MSLCFTWLVPFTAPTFIAGAGLLVKADDACQAGAAFTLSDLRGKRAVVAGGTTGEMIVALANEAL